MTGLDAVTAVVRYLNAYRVFLFTGETGEFEFYKGSDCSYNCLYTDICENVFKYEKEKGYSGEYIVVNNLPFVHKDDVQVCTVNINIHVPKLSTEQSDTARLTAITRSVIALFDSRYGAFIDGAYFKFYADSRPTEDNDGTYYVNIQLDCIFENISKD